MNPQETDWLARVVKNFEEAEQASQSSREEAEIARDYFDGKQWTEEERSILTARKQPVITDNMLKDKLEYLIGLEASSRSDPKAYPRNPQDDDGAEAATDAMRYVAENNDLDTIVSDVAENMLIEGFGGCEIIVEPRGDEVEIIIKRNRWDRMYFDPHSLEKNFSDARYRGTCVWLDLEAARDEWPDVDWDAIGDSMAESASDTYDDKPTTRWYDKERKRVRVVEQYYRHGPKWMACKFIKDAWVEEPTESPYQLEDESDDAYAWMSAYVDRDGNRYGVVRRYKDLQDEINHRRSKALHLLNTNQTQYESGAFNNVNKARKEIQKPDGMVEYNPGFQINIDKNVELSAGQAQLMQQSRDALSTTGPRAVSNTSAQSGRAKEIDQQNDVIELGRLFDQLRALKREIYRKIFARVKGYWTEAKWVRIRDEEGNAKFAQLNQPITALEYAERVAQESPDELPQALMMAQQNPQAIVGIRNNVAEMDVDIIIEDAPDVINLQQEQFAGLVSLATAGVTFPPDVYIQASQLRNKDQVLEKLTGADNPEAQAQIQQEQQLTMAERMTALQEQAAKTRKLNAEAAQTELENKVGTAAAVGMATQ